MDVKILSAEQIRAWDQYTIEHEPIVSVDLMERAAAKCAEWLATKYTGQSISILCGKGNNGGDGLAIARLLTQKQFQVSVYILEFGKAGTEDFQKNLQRLHELQFTNIHFIQSADHLPALKSTDVVVDALFGTGLNKPLVGLAADIVKHVNSSAAEIISIDVPTGIFTDRSSKDADKVAATHTLTFQTLKYAFLMQENGGASGEVHVLDIGLADIFLNSITPVAEKVETETVKKIYKPRNRFTHKGNFGHALLVAGAFGKVGAAVLATKACIRSGAGLTTAFVPLAGYEIMQIAVPEAMVITDDESESTAIHSLPDDIDRFSAVGLGPGLGTKECTIQAITFITRRFRKPMVIDADGLNCIALKPELIDQLPAHSIITPHPKEFDRLFGEHQNDFDRIEKARQIASAKKLIVMVKSHHTAIALPDGRLYFNATGNAGLAKGGSGDVLTGVLTALLAQQYTPEEAAILGCYVHGAAADLAVKHIAIESLIARDVINHLPQAFATFATSKP